MSTRTVIYLLVLAGVTGVCGADSPTPASASQCTSTTPLNVGPVPLNGTAYASAATVTANALGSGVDGPANSSSPCTPGQLGADQNFIYVCVAANRWRRSPLSAF